MAWRAITEADILTRMSDVELSTFREAALGDGQADPVASIIAQITGEARGYCAGNEENTLGPEGTIPESLLGTCLDLIVIEMQTRVAGLLIDPQEIRERKMERAERKLRDVSGGHFKIEQPESGEATDETFGGVSPASSAPTRTFDRDSQDGI